MTEKKYETIGLLTEVPRDAADSSGPVTTGLHSENPLVRRAEFGRVMTALLEAGLAMPQSSRDFVIPNAVFELVIAMRDEAVREGERREEAMRLTTIEACAKVADETPSADRHPSVVRNSIADRIRSLGEKR